MENTQGVWFVYIIAFSFNFLTIERHLILGTTRLKQHIF